MLSYRRKLLWYNHIGNASSQAGTIFKINPAGNFTTLFTWPSNSSLWPNTIRPGAGIGRQLLWDNAFCSAPATGTIFKYSSAGALSILRSFDATTDGASPVAGLARGSDGSFYGLTPSGGSHSFGTVFSISSSGTMATLFNFADPPGPEFNFIQAADGNLYTALGGDGENTYGRILKVTPPNNVSLLYDDPYPTQFRLF